MSRSAGDSRTDLQFYELGGTEDGDLLRYIRSIRKRLWAVLLLAGAITLVGAAIVNSLTPLYRSSASLMLEPLRQSATDNIGKTLSPYSSDTETQIEVLRSRKVIVQTVQRLELWNQREFDPRQPASPWRQRVRDWLGMPAPAAPEWTEEKLADSVYDTFIGRITIEPVAGSRVLKVGFDSEDADLAPRIVNTWLQVFIDEDRAARQEMTRGFSGWLQQRAQALLDNVNGAEDALQQFREKNDLVNVRGATQALSTRQMEELIPQVIAARVRVTELESAYKQVRSVRNDDYSAVPWVMSSSAAMEAKTRETSARLRVAELGRTYGFEHPRIVQAQGELAEARANLQRQVAAAVASLTREYETAQATLAALEQAVGKERDQAQVVNRAEFQLGVLERAVESNRQLYELFISSSRQMDLASGMETAVARIIDRAFPSYVPVKPKRSRLILAIALLGLTAGMGMAFLLEMLDDTVKGPEDAERRLQMPVLTSLPLLRDVAESDIATKVLTEPGSLYSEAVRTARTGLLLSTLDHPNPVFVVTSSTVDEGKTTTALNLALSLAQSRSTLLIEADMRRPRLAEALALGASVRGLSDLVSGGCAVKECVHRIEGSTLSVIPAGTKPPNPLELLSSPRFAAAVRALRQRFDVVIIDTPPVEAVSDALVVARHGSAVLYVVSVGDSRLPLVRRGLARLQRADAQVVGLVLNRVDFAKAQRFYGEYTGYGKLGYSYEPSY